MEEAAYFDFDCVLHPPPPPLLISFFGVWASLYFKFLIFQVKDGTILALKTLNLRPRVTSTLA